MLKQAVGLLNKSIFLSIKPRTIMPENKTLEQLKREKEKVIVSIWTSKFNNGKGIGHISLFLPDYYCYISLWPEKMPNLGQGIFIPVAHKFLPSLATDKHKKYEGRDPEVLIEFHNLNALNIYQAYEQLRQTLKGWTLIACKDGESCASLAYRLLQAGGIGALLSDKDRQLLVEASIASQGSAAGSTASFSHIGQAGSFVLGAQFSRAREALDKAGAKSCYSIEMGLGAIIKSPDFLVELLRKAEQADLVKLQAELDKDLQAQHSLIKKEAAQRTCCLTM